MESFSIALIGEGICSWDGGLDFLINIAKAIERIEYMDMQCNLIVVFPKYTFMNKKIRSIFGRDIKHEDERINLSIETFKVRCPNIKVYRYQRKLRQFEKYPGESLDLFLQKRGIDVALPVLANCYPNMRIPWVGYIPDMQERYLPNFFTEIEIKRRYAVRKKQLEQSRYILVTSNSVKDDIIRFYPEAKCRVFVTPFAPIAADEYIDTSGVDFEGYGLPEKYFIICNQFWMHKSHSTAFMALKLLHGYTEYKNIHIVCTGKMDDYRNREYCEALSHQVESLGLEEYIHFLGYIPKNDQIEIMKKSIALIQPTLFEGDAGGCATYDAVSIGVPCILSDIKVNQEVGCLDDVIFFKVKDSESLKNAMITMLSREVVEINSITIKNKIEANSRILSSFYYDMLKTVKYNL